MDLLLLFALALLGLAAVTGFFLHRASRARRELSARLYETGLALDRRCDALDEAIRRLERRPRIDHLFTLVSLGEAEGRFDGEVAHTLRRYLLKLRSESLA